MAKEHEHNNKSNSPKSGFTQAQSANITGGMARSLGGFGGMGRGSGGRHGGMTVVKPRDFKKTLKRLWAYFGKERSLLTFVFVLVVISVGIGLAGPYLIGHAIDALSAKGVIKLSSLRNIALMLLAVYAGDFFTSVIQGWLMAGVSQRIVFNLRHKLFGKLQKLSVSFFDFHTHGDLMSRLTNDIDSISSNISQTTIQLMSSSLTITGALVMMLLLSPLLTLAGIITAPMVFLLANTITKRTKSLFKEQQVILGKLNGDIEETISGIQIVKAFNHEERSIRQFDEINMQLCRVGIKAQIWSGYLMPLMNVINNLGFIAISGIGGVLAVNNLVSVGIIASFLSYSRQFIRPLNELANTFNMLQTSVAGAERVFDTLDEKEEQEDSPEAIVLDNPRGHVVFENVSFGYREDVRVLDNISFEAHVGSTIAIIGPTGAGKTTIANLLTRFYDVDGGRILIDGNDIREYTRDSLRRCFGMVLQDTYLFSGTIRDNIKFGRPEATDKEVKKAAVMANAHAFVNRLPKQYDTVLSESGGSLSQGQRQLLAIARAILADPAILILDEATSSVDTRTELSIQEAMLKLMKGRTCFIIAHRLSTIRDADTIMVIEGGRIVESGSHDVLIKKKGKYHELYFSQFNNR